eukprot:scaffold271468_cov32-Tisochrysis_lutea.AAC.1
MPSKPSLVCGRMRSELGGKVARKLPEYSMYACDSIEIIWATGGTNGGSTGQVIRTGLQPSIAAQPTRTHSAHLCRRLARLCCPLYYGQS